MIIRSINPATGEQISLRSEHTPAEVQGLVEATQAAFLVWRETNLVDRAASLLRVARVLRRDRTRFAELITSEMGKPLAQAVSELDKCAVCCEHFADFGATYLSPDFIRTEARRSYVLPQPLGIVLAVMPWNFPFWQVFRAAIPALMAGNAVLLKHASNVSGCALACEEVFAQCELPPSLFRTALIDSGRASELIAHPLIKAVTVTGSTPAGVAVAAQAGAMLKKTVLELGGSDPYLILEDADLGATVEACVTSRLLNAGQSCIAAKRFIVVERARKRFEAALVMRLGQQVMGDPRQVTTTLGPLARWDLRDTLQRQVEESLTAGAMLLCGGEIPAGPGAFYPPTALTQVTPGMPVFDEETFGPVAAIISAVDEADAIRLANQSLFGLGAAVFTTNLERGERVAAQLEAGGVAVNDYVRSDPRLPFGGIKQSGYGRELCRYGLLEFVNLKTVWVK